MRKKSSKRPRGKKFVSILIFINLLLISYILFFSNTPFSQKTSSDFGVFLAEQGEKIGAFTFAPSSQTEILPGEMEVDVFDVGQGSSTLFLSGGKTILIDAGDQGEGYRIADQLAKKGITSIDVFIATHPHADHIGGMVELMEKVDLGQIMMPELPRNIIPTSRVYLDVLEKIEAQGKVIIPAKSGDFYEIGKMKLDILAPSIAYGDLNNNSIASKITFHSRSVLVTGDAEKESEKNMLLFNQSMLACDIFVAGHHGSKTSNTEEFLQAVHPAYVAISCGKNNSYGLPHEQVIDRMEKMGCKIYRTDQNGTIRFILSDEKIVVECEKDQTVQY